MSTCIAAKKSRESRLRGEETHSGDDSTDHELKEPFGVTKGRDLDDGSDDHDGATKEHHMPTTETFTVDKRKDGTDERTKQIEGRGPDPSVISFGTK